MRSPVSLRRVIRAIPEIGVGLLIAFGIGITVISLFFALVEALS